MESGLRVIVDKNKAVECVFNNGKIAKGISGHGRLTLNIINKIHNYYGQVTRNETERGAGRISFSNETDRLLNQMCNMWRRDPGQR